MWIKTLTILFTLIASTAWSQLSVDARSAIQLSGIEEAEKIGTTIFVASDSTVAKLPVILVTATTEAANITFEVSDKDRIPVNFTQLTEDTIMISAPGKSWVRVVAIDFDKNIYATNLIPVELGDIPPDPDKPNPVPPDGPFDSIAARVAVIASQMAISERDQLSTLLKSAAAKMQRFEFKTLTQVREYVEKGWSNTVPAKQLLELLVEDNANRLLNWDQAQKYYLEVVKGLQ